MNLDAISIALLVQSASSQNLGLPHDLFVGALGSLIGWLLSVALTYILSRRLKVQMIRSVLRLFGIGIDRVYKNQAEAEKDIIAALEKATTIRILGMRGRSIVEGYLTSLIRQQPFRKVHILLADPDAPEGFNPVTLRAKEIARTEPDISPSIYLAEGRDTLRSFYRWNLNARCCLRVYQFPAVFRVVSTDSSMFLSFYPASGRGKDNVMFCLPNSSPLYTMIARYFDHTWDDLRTSEPAQYRVTDSTTGSHSETIS